MSAPTEEDMILRHAQGCFMEWIKLLEYEVAKSKEHFDLATAAGKGDSQAFGHHIGKAAGHNDIALGQIRRATAAGF